MMRANLILLVMASLLAGCVSTGTTPSPALKLVPGDPKAPSQVTPSESLAIAEQYARQPWRPFATNIKHGDDRKGIRVDTPDVGYNPESGRKGWWVPGVVNLGIPYKWGGYDDPEVFVNRVAQGAAAGDVSTPEKRQADNAAVSHEAAGVDCSGFVSKCLRLPSAYDTAHLPSICDPLPDATLMQPGDLLNIPRRHVLLFAGWADKQRTWVRFYDTGAEPEWKPALKQAPLDKLLTLGYQPIRYRGMAREEAPSGKEVLSRDVLSRVVTIEDPKIGDP